MTQFNFSTNILWQRRSLLLAMIQREWRIRYAGTGLRWLWLILRPLLQLGVYALVFVFILKVESKTTPYILHLLTGLMAWQVFLESVNSAGRAVYLDGDLIKKTTVPRLYLPLYRSLLNMPDLLVYMVLYGALAVYYHQGLSWTIIVLPLAIGLNWLLAFGLGCWVSVWGVFQRDLHHLFFTVVGYLLWVTPVFYAPDMLDSTYRFVLFFNPLASIVALYRFSFYAEPLSWAVGVGCFVLISVAVSGIYYYQKKQAYFADNL